jgi:serine/threonine-protein kinase
VTLADPVLVRVPSLVGGSLGLARERLKAVRLLLDEPPAERETPDAPPGTVVVQQPAAGEPVAVGSAVSVVVAVSPQTDGVEVPSVLGMDLDTAKERLARAALQLNVAAREPSAEPEGSIIRQEPEVGARAPRGSTVQVTVAIAQPNADLAEVPAVLGQPLDRAKQLLARARLRMDVADPVRSTQPVETVARQRPAAGQRVPVGTTVTVNPSLGRG